MPLIEVLETQAFFSLWFWALAGLAWAFACHWTAGVPNDLIDRAKRGDAAAAEDCRALVQIQARRIVSLGLARAVIAGLTGFAIAVLGTLGLWFGDPPSLALFLLTAPLGLALLGSLRGALRLADAGIGADELIRLLRRLRLNAQFLAALSLILIFAAALWQALVRNGILPAGQAPLRAIWALVAGS